MKEPVCFSKKKMYTFEPVFDHLRTWGRFSVRFSHLNVSIGSHYENRVSIWEPDQEPDKHLRIAQHWIGPRYHAFIDCENSKVDRRHLYEWCRKNPVQTEFRRGRNGWTKLTIQYNSTQNHTNFIYFWAEKNHHCFGLFSALLCFEYLVWADPSYMFMRFVTWAKSKIWKWSC
jgi:hypothetical protein